MPNGNRKARERLRIQQTQIHGLEAEVKDLKVETLRLTGEINAAEVELRLSNQKLLRLATGTLTGRQQVNLIIHYIQISCVNNQNQAPFSTSLLGSHGIRSTRGGSIPTYHLSLNRQAVEPYHTCPYNMLYGDQRSLLLRGDYGSPQRLH